MKKYIEIVLYYADWCNHCVKFKPEWEKFKKHMMKDNNKNINTENSIKINVSEFNDEQLEKIGGGKINGEDITGYPTIKLRLSNGKESKEYDYENYGKSKDHKYMTNFVKIIHDLLIKM